MTGVCDFADNPTSRVCDSDLRYLLQRLEPH